MSESFSSRNSFRTSPPITIWHDAPADFRYALTVIAKDDCNMGAHWAREAVCSILRTPPDSSNWSEGPVTQEIDYLITRCSWYQVYDVAEGMFQRLEANDKAQAVRKRPGTAETFQTKLNEVMAEKGIGWEMAGGKLRIRGEPAQQIMIEKTNESLEGFPAAERRLEEAFQDLARRPVPDIEGAITHAFAALESVCRKITGKGKEAFGDIIKTNRSLFPDPSIAGALEKMWGYASNHARHQTEERPPPDIHEAYLLVGTVASAIIYVTKRIGPKDT